MKKIKLIQLLALTIIFGCNEFSDVVDFTVVTNPNLSESSVVGQPNSALIWRLGIEREVSRTLNEILILAELGSDNYANTQTFFSQFLDNLDIRTTDPDIRDTQNQIARVARMAEFGLEAVGPNDPNYDSEVEAEFNYFLGISRLFAGMYFSMLPEETLGAPVSSAMNYTNAISSFEAAISINAKPEYHLAKARAHYYLGNQSEAVSAASSALSLSSDFLRFAEFDEAEDPDNTLEDALYERGTFDDFQPLPTLDFLDPKYSFVSAEEDSPVHYLKAEEAYLILAEGNLADGNLSNAKQNLKDLLSLVNGRMVREVNESGETRGNQENAVADAIRPSNSNVVVNGRSGLVLDRGKPEDTALMIPSISGTSLTMGEIDSMTIGDDALELLYRTRQEIFIAEGIRFVDMGVKLVINENEILLNENINEGDAGTTPSIPSFIDSVKDDLDAFTYDMDNNTASTMIDLNTILVQNKNASEVLPFH